MDEGKGGSEHCLWYKKDECPASARSAGGGRDRVGKGGRDGGEGRGAYTQRERTAMRTREGL